MAPAILHTPEADLARLRARLAAAGIGVLVALGVLFARLVQLQVVEREYYRTRAEDNRIAVVPVVPNRGLVTDRNGVVLARNHSAYTLEITPSKVADLDATIDALGELIDVQPRDRKRFRKLLEESRNFESLPIRSRLTDEEVARFAANRYRFPGVEIKARLFRQYPLGELAAHAIGYLGRVASRDVDRIEAADEQANYRGTEHFGKSGVEQTYEFELHGQAGAEQVEVDAGGHAVRVLSRSAPIAGNDLVLTLDAKLQAVAEQAFGKRRGALVAIEPSSGDVLAYVSRPGFDPNLFVDGIDPQTWDELNGSPDRPMLNRPIGGTYAPGSTFKPYMALAALTLGKRTPGQTISDPGYFMFGGHQFRDDKKGGHGTVDMYKSIVASCDTYYYMLANDLGIDNISGFMRQFGFGEATGIDLEGELDGVLPSQEWKRKRFKRREQQKWYAGETISIGIGQGYNAYTPIQLAQAVATLANDGVMFRPHLVKYIVNARTGVRTQIAPEPVRRIPLKQAHIDFIRNAMVGVNREGTGARAFAGAGYVSGGKTGTAQLYSLRGGKYEAGKVSERLRDHALFIAFAPAERPTIALAVLVENGGFGAQSAAPIARQVLDYRVLGKLPAAPAAEDPSQPEED